MKNQKATVMRDSNLELYRIIVMLLIVAHHYVVNSGLTGAGGPVYSHVTSLSSLFLLLWGAWGKIGINCFVLITGYFMCKSQITAQKFVKLLFTVMFYRLVINGVFWITGYAKFSPMALIKVLIPFTKLAQNFTGTFLVFFLCIPFLNVLVRNLTEKQHLQLILLVGFTYVLFGTVPGLSVTMNYVSWYMVLYIIASYIRLYPKACYTNTRLWALLTLLCVALCSASVVIGAYVGAKTGQRWAYRFVTDSNTLLAVLTGVCSFMLFKNLKIKPSRLINTVSATTFGVLMIHANGESMRRWLWVDLLDNVGAYGNTWMPLHAVGSVLAVFVVCSLIDLVRIHLLEKPFFRTWDKHLGKVESAVSRWEQRLCQRYHIGGGM